MYFFFFLEHSHDLHKNLLVQKPLGQMRSLVCCTVLTKAFYAYPQGCPTAIINLLDDRKLLDKLVLFSKYLDEVWINAMNVCCCLTHLMVVGFGPAGCITPENTCGIPNTCNNFYNSLDYS